MSKRGFLRGLTLAVSLHIAWATPPPAAACTPPACRPSVRHFPAGTVPANLIFFKVLAPELGQPLELLELRDQAGRVLPANVRVIGGDRVFAPVDVPPANQTLTLHGELSCHPYSFWVGPPVEPSPRRPSLTLTGQGHEGGEFLGGEFLAQLTYTPPDAHGAVTHLLEHETTIDGRAPFFLFRVAADANEHRLEVRSYCGASGSEGWVPGPCGGFDKVPAGRHTVRVATHVVGFQPDPETIEATIDTTCNQPDTRTPSFGCAITRDARPSAGIALLALAALLLACRRAARPRHEEVRTRRAL